MKPQSLDVKIKIEAFSRSLARSYSPAGNNSPNDLKFAGLFHVPDFTYPTGPAQTITPDIWSDALNAKVLHTVATAQAFLSKVISCNARILILTPTIMSSLRPPFHGIESAVVGALEGFTSSLRGELAPLGVPVCRLKLGSFDHGSSAGRQQLQHSQRSDILSLPASVRAAYASNYLAQRADAEGFRILSRQARGLKGSPLRELNNAVFDALTDARPWSVQRVGRGSLIYELIGT